MIDGDGRGGYMSQTRHYPSYKPGGNGILLVLYVASLMKVSMVMKEVIVVGMMEEVYLGLNITATINFTIM